MRRNNLLIAGLLLSFSLITVGCSTQVSESSLYGSYVASYPFGMEKMTVNHDGTFVQVVSVNGQAPVTAHGEWKFDSSRSQIDFYGSMWVVDGFGHLRSDWQKITPGLTALLPAERLWFRITLDSGGNYPYVKQ